MKSKLITIALIGLMATAPALIQSAKADSLMREDFYSQSGVASFCRDRLVILKAA